MLAVPPALLELLRPRPGAKVGLAVESGRLIVDPRTPPRYTLKESSPSAIRKRRSPGKSAKDSKVNRPAVS